MCAVARQSLAVTARALTVTISLAWTAAILDLQAFRPAALLGGGTGAMNRSEPVGAGGSSTAGLAGGGPLQPAGPPEGLVCIWMLLSFVLVQVACVGYEGLMYLILN
jgi:hypothetical protein